MRLLFLILLSALASAQPQPETAIADPIDADKAIRFLYGNDATYRDGERELIVGEYATQSGSIDGKELWFLYTTANSIGNTCHACQVILGAAMFEKQGARWIKRADDRNVASIGSLGVPLDSKPV